VRLLVVTVVVAAAAFVGFRLTGENPDERRFAAIAGDIAHRKVSVRCQSRVGELVDVDWDYGSVEFDRDGRPSDHARLDRAICASLGRLARGQRVRPESAALAVEALAHEAYHLSGIQDEAATQCYGLQAMRFVAARLGVTAALGHEYVRLAVARYPALPEQYRSDQCREGGTLDLHPETGVFP
jgi:hypothetical protein